MLRRLLLAVVLLIVLGGAAAPFTAQAQGSLVIASQPETAVLYQGDLAYLSETHQLGGDIETIITLPPGTRAESLIVLRDGDRLRNYRLTTQEGAPALILPATNAPHTLTLAYLANGAGWEPLYDMTIGDDDTVQFGFDALIHNAGLPLDGAAIQLAAGMPGAQPGYQPDMTVTQANVLAGQYLPGGSGGAVDILHVYDIGAQTLLPGETLRHTLAYDSLPANRVQVWDARFGQRVDVIYQIENTTGAPFVPGPVSAYESGLYIGTDAIEWTPAGSVGSVTVAGLSSIRVRRTESVAVVSYTDDNDDRHDVTLSITNHGDEDVALVVLDEWNRAGFDFAFSQEPTRQGNNVLRWELTIPAGEQIEVTYVFYRD